MSVQPQPPVRRFLHICYCCDNTDQVVDFFVAALDMKEVMRNQLHPSDGSVLGVEGEIVSGAAFIYDQRGARFGASIEVQEWVSPKIQGQPLADPAHVGIHAVGFAVPDIDETLQRLMKAGAQIISRAKTPWTEDWATVRDPHGAHLDIFQDGSVPIGQSRVRHLRITVSDMEVSLPWYRGLGFIDIDDHEMSNADFIGLQATDGSSAEGIVHRLKLPDEQCEVVLCQWTNPPSHGQALVAANSAGFYRTAVCVDDTRRSYEEFLQAGWQFERAPLALDLTGTAVPEMWICFLNDPDGVPFEFVGRPRSAFRS